MQFNQIQFDANQVSSIQFNFDLISGGLNCTEWIELVEYEYNWIEMNWVEVAWKELNWIELDSFDWFEMSWIELNWIELHRIPQSWA